MLNTNTVKEIIKFVEAKVNMGATIEEALIELDRREEARGGDIRAVVDFIGGSASVYFTLKQELRLEQEISAQEIPLDVESTKYVVKYIEKGPNFYVAYEALRSEGNKEVQRVLDFIGKSRHTYQELKNELETELEIQAQEAIQ